MKPAFFRLQKTFQIFNEKRKLNFVTKPRNVARLKVNIQKNEMDSPCTSNAYATRLRSAPASKEEPSPKKMKEAARKKVNQEALEKMEAAARRKMRDAARLKIRDAARTNKKLIKKMFVKSFNENEFIDTESD